MKKVAIAALTVGLVVAAWSAPASAAARTPKIFYNSDVEGPSNVYMMNTDGSQKENLSQSTLRGRYFGSVSPDGTEVVMFGQTDDLDQDGGIDYALFIKKIGSPELPQMIANDDARDKFEPRFSPTDGSKIAFIKQDPDGSKDVYVLDRNTGEQKELFDPDTVKNSLYRSVDDLDWSPDGTRLVVKSDHDSVYGELYIIDLNGNMVKPLTSNGESEYDVHWSPDGDKVSYFRRHYDAGLQKYVNDLYTVDVASGAETKVTPGLTFGGDSAWSPDGDTLVISGELAKTTGTAIYTIKEDGSKLTKLEDVSATTYVAGWANVAQ
ncbi:TolB family protein [Laceyella putida]|uniref:TolB family protein n=1 Tax=Laceyella putida TaxID=110101 RepID=A0ABW2RJP8_9BACL